MKRRELAFDPNFEREHELLSKEYSDTFDKELLTITKKEPDSKDPLLALRCRVSFPIYEKINLIYKTAIKLRASGGIGIRAGLRNQCRKA